MGPLISVIVPIYKVEDYLEKCIESILNQSYKNLEIILIDDGSPDNCPSICDRYEKLDTRIYVIHKKNGGLSDARNAGLEKATGEYISFVDSDDWLDGQFYEIMLSHILKENLDLVECGFVYVKDNEHKEEVHHSYDQAIFSNVEAMNFFICDKLFREIVWNKLYKRKVLGRHMFLSVNNEDEYWTYKIFANANRVGYIAKALYFYLQRESSIMSSKSIKELGFLEALKERSNFIRSQYPQLDYECRYRLFRRYIFQYQLIIEDSTCDDKRRSFRIIRTHYKDLKLTIKEISKMPVIDIMTYLSAKINIYLTCFVRNKLHIIKY